VIVLDTLPALEAAEYPAALPTKTEPVAVGAPAVEAAAQPELPAAEAAEATEAANSQ
jgi:hypothetical protein